jgi:hypothetical protein
MSLSSGSSAQVSCRLVADSGGNQGRMGMTFLTKYPENVVVERHAGVGEQVHHVLPDCLLTEFADRRMRRVPREPAAEG